MTARTTHPGGGMEDWDDREDGEDGEGDDDDLDGTGGHEGVGQDGDGAHGGNGIHGNRGGIHGTHGGRAGGHDPRELSGELGPADSIWLPNNRRGQDDISNAAREAWLARDQSRFAPVDPAEMWWMRKIAPLPAGPSEDRDAGDSPALPPALPPVPPVPPVPPLEEPQNDHTPPPDSTTEVWRVWQHSPQGRAYERQAREGRERRERRNSGDLVTAGGRGTPGAAGQGNRSTPRLAMNTGNPGNFGGSEDDAAENQGGPLGRLSGSPRRLTARWGQLTHGAGRFIPPGGPGALAAQVAFEEEEAMAALSYAVRPYSFVAEPFNLYQAITREMRDVAGRNLAVGVCPMPGDHILGRLLIHRGRIDLSPRLFPHSRLNLMEQEWAMPDERRQHTLAQQIEEGETSAIIRVVLGTLFLAWYAHDKLAALALGISPEQIHAASAPLRMHDALYRGPWAQRQPLFCAFAPLSLPPVRGYRSFGPQDSRPRGTRWQPWHARHYDWLWTNLGYLLLGGSMLAAQTAEYLDMDEAPARHQVAEYVWQKRRQMLLTHYGSARYPETSLRNMAWEHYITTLARRNHVPPRLVRSRLDCPPPPPPNSAQGLVELTNRVCEEGGDTLANWRDDVAYWFGTTLGDVALWLAEPATYVPALPE